MPELYTQLYGKRWWLGAAGIAILLVLVLAVFLRPWHRTETRVLVTRSVKSVQSSTPTDSRSTIPDSGSTIQFTDVTAQAGINFTHFAGASGQKWYPETIGSGSGFFDYDQDGWVDLLLINGSYLDNREQRTADHPTPTMHLYRNRGDGTFEDVTKAAGLALPLYGMGMAAADYDNDGDSDLLVTGYQRHLFFVNNGNGTFTDATATVGIAGGTWGSGAAFFDYDRDGYLDLVITSYVEWRPDLEAGLDCNYGTPDKDYCPVRYFKGQGLQLYHNRGNGTFEDVTRRAGVTAQGARAFAPLIIDYNDDLWPDMLITNDGTPTLLFRNRGDGTFEEVGMRTGLVLDEGSGAYAGMGLDAAYPKNDDQLCIAIGNFVGEPTTLHCRSRLGTSYHRELYAEVSAWSGIGRPTLRSVTFGLFFFDVDLDGYEDLFMANGHVIDEAHLRNAPRAQLPQLFRNLGNGKFKQLLPAAGSALAQPLVGRGAAYADYDQDGDLDIVISQNQAPALLLRNDTPRQAHFLRVHLQGTRSNRDGIGAMVHVQVGDKVMRRMLYAGRSYYSQHEMILTFGLAEAEQADRVEVVWPSGLIDVHHNVPADTNLRIVEGKNPKAPTSPPLAATDATPPAKQLTSDLPDAATNQAFMAQIQTGIDAYRAEQFAAATQAFEVARKLRPSELLPYRYLADLYWQQGLAEQAAEAVHALATEQPDAYYLDRLGGDNEAADLLGLALLFYKEAVRLNPDFPSARYNLGRAYLNSGDLEAGIHEVQAALRLYPEFAEGHLTLGLAYTEQGHLDLAIQQMQRALQIQPDLAAARNHLGRLYTVQGNLQAATQTYQALVKAHPDAAEARHNLAVALARQGQQAAAISEFRAALRIRPDLHAARIDLATLLLEAQRPQAAIDALQPIASDASAGFTGEPSNAVNPTDVTYRLGIAYLMLRQVDKAKQQFERTIEKQPKHAPAHLYLARLYLQTGQYDSAWRQVRLAEALGEPVAEIIDVLRRISPEP